jgi:LmbE family N-acetylglucosaminyl deacetylase
MAERFIRIVQGIDELTIALVTPAFQTFLYPPPGFSVMAEARKVLVICAHSDDQVIGAGGTIAKFARDGGQVRTFICSFGEQSHPHLKEIDVRKMRVAESKTADKVLGGHGVLFLGMKEGHFLEDYDALQWREKLLRHIHVFKPAMILTHSPDDPHPDHRAVYKIVLDLHSKGKLNAEVYTFDIWTLFHTSQRHSPRLVIDISKSFTRKLDALSSFRSQKVALFTLLWSVYVKAVYYGLKRGVRYAEVFHRVR